ncbi:MAG: bifunctional phosphoribosyl-AMP cyclohydrolase/phosphoribosyl-ATP diphosphatase HisIE [Clostridiales bacterium]|nr:bifunctional phosphoribosyl-AMP cyclohydrolase/phosphoribosyl-ATP diphosphatase HisIE [Clostridiales bacterium]
MVKIEDIKFDDRGLVPAIVVDADTNQVLTLAYMNEESLRISLEKKLTCFWSRSRQELWLKGETSGNYQHIVSITADCDRDALVVKVKPDGPACHLGTWSCFDYPVLEAEDLATERASSIDNTFSYEGLMELIRGRKTEGKEGSYTTYLFEKGLDKILKKVGEESTEVIIAAKAEDKKETIYEIADLAYHIMVLMVEAGISLEDITEELASRHVIDHKVKQEKMT